MKLKIFICVVHLIVFSNTILSQNVLSIGSKQVNVSTELELAISLENTNEIAAVQFDMTYDSSAFELLTGHSLTNRALNYSFGINSISENKIRIVIYSFGNSNISGNSGILFGLKLKAKNNPGDFPFTLSNVIFSSNSGTPVTSSTQNGSVKVLGSKMQILTKVVDFDRVLLNSNPVDYITIENTGNIALEITGYSAINPFIIKDNFPIIIGKNSQMNVALSLDTSTKYSSSKVLSFVNNDADVLRNSQSVTLNATVYAVNEIHIGNGSGTINTEIEIPVYINNMEAFNGFQFDVLLPADISYVNNSILQSLRFNGHSISASVVNGNILRFIAYSGSNTDFKGNSGELFRFKLKPALSSGTHSLNISNPILSNATLGNIESDSFNGYLQINSPNLTIDPSVISYGNLPITESRTSTVTLYNTGSSALLLDAIVISSSQLAIAASLPVEISPGASKIVSLTYKPTISGSFSETVSFRYNGPDLQKIVNVQANVFSPNYVMVENQTGIKNQVNNFSILLKNNDAVRAIQFDVELPSGFNLQSSTLTTTARSAGFNVSASLLSANKYRVLLYSVSNVSLIAGTESIINFPVFLNSDLGTGTYSFVYSNVIISNTTNQNVSSVALEDGKITVTNGPIVLNAKVILQGPYVSSTGLMTDQLRSRGLIPTISPYADASSSIPSVFNLGGTSATGLAKDDIVDWVWVELRDKINNTIIKESKSALLQRDGDVVGVDGISALSFSSSADNYYVMIRHRNHIGIRSSGSISISSTVASFDFSANSLLVSGGINGIASIGSGKYALFAGDINGDGQIQNADKNAAEALRGISGYSNADVDMNNEVQNAEINSVLNPNIGKGKQF